MPKDKYPPRPLDSVTGDLEQIRLALMEEYEQGRNIDIAAWAARFPEHRDELLDYWIWLRGTTPLSRVANAPPPPRDAVAANALQRATEAIALGKAWLDDAVDDAYEGLARALRALRGRPYEFRGKARKPFRKAAVYAWAALSLGKSRPRVSRLAAQKTAYFLERGLELDLFTDYQRKPLGPYDHTAKYRDAEPIAEEQGWLAIQGAGLEPGPSADKVHGYSQRYVRSPDLALRIVEVLAPLSDAELETWATVDWAAHQIKSRGERIDVRAIVGFLERSAEWKQKLGKANFSEARIRDALVQLVRLGFVDLHA